MNEIVKNRQEMAQLLNDRMNRTYAAVAQERELEPDTSLVKTYLVEAHLHVGCRQGSVQAVLDSVFAPRVVGKESSARIHATDDEDLFLAEATVRAAGAKERVLLYIDASNTRFWIVHSMSSSKCLDPLMKKLVSSTQDLDTAWIPAELLEKVSTYGAFRGLSLDYDRRNIPDVDFEAPEAPVESLKMQLWANRAGDVLRILREKGAFPHETTLAKVKVKFWLSEDRNGEFCIDDIKYNGKITSRGTSFQSHMALVSSVYKRYAERIVALEDRFSVGYQTEDGRLRITGEPINFVLRRPINDLEVFCNSLFSCSEPFRLWGVPVRLSDEYWLVSAVDLHVGSQISFEIAPEFIRLYLPQGSCGNTVLRVYTNLQHHYSALIGVTDGSNERILQF
jgi:hypothetical protein